MSQATIVYPAFAHVVLTLVVMVIMGMRRSASLREKKHTADNIALGQDVWTAAATKAARNYSNQFEMPVLFHAACAMALAAKAVDPTMIGLAWGFVAARVVHSCIHLWPNQVPARAAAFLVGALLTLAMWILLVAKASA